ncbi:DEAD/DEAH box helicase [Salibacterium salarium]|uniref:DEAD/DEAH box helicase n=1 Tax=Salibacterium salarium TaxID=284579 RepID=A0A3R9WN22_9BACI|nr:DEAD/DEAH box helicase [Salibacterium salarium]RSL29950.1 DEAD/DEAH box helicase [Salibacterium salarium]
MNYCHTPRGLITICLPELLVENKSDLLAGPSVISRLPDLPIPPSTSEPSNIPYYTELQEKLAGKELLYEEIEYSWEDLKPFLEAGLITLRAGLRPFKKGYWCQRCHTTSKDSFGIFDCSRCGETCVYCRHCIMMGRISACSVLLRWNGPSPITQTKENSLDWNGTFSTGQQMAAQRITETIQQQAEILVWAVCGAGKTEVLFPGLEQALQQGQRVLLTTPRTDVVLELLPRLKKVLPTTSIAGLYGDSEEKDAPAQLIIATTHQTMRFHAAFDTVIIDEVDAFPYTADISLIEAVKKAKKQAAATIHLTATPTKMLQKRVASNDLPCVRIPRRYHGFPLPVPRLAWIGSWQKRIENGKLPAKILEWCRYHIEQEIPAFFFVPSVTVLESVTDLLKNIWPAVEGVHSADPDRLEKVERFRQGVVPLLVTTSILERGVTVAGVDVAVLGAESAIFTESALVQIAGRAGRSKDQPDGDVVFFHYGKTNAITAAKRHIKSMNREPVDPT